MFKNGVGGNTKMIFTFLNGDVVKTSEIAFVSRMEEKYIDNYTHKFYYNIIVNNIELERNLTIYIDRAEIYKQFIGSLAALVYPCYIINGAKKFDEKIKVQYRDVMMNNNSDLHVVNFAGLQCFKNFNQERLNLIEKLK